MTTTAKDQKTITQEARNEYSKISRTVAMFAVKGITPPAGLHDAWKESREAFWTEAAKAQK